MGGNPGFEKQKDRAELFAHFTMIPRGAPNLVLTNCLPKPPLTFNETLQGAEKMDPTIPDSGAKLQNQSKTDRATRDHGLCDRFSTEEK